MGVKKFRATPYHRQVNHVNGQVERFNRTLTYNAGCRSTGLLTGLRHYTCNAQDVVLFMHMYHRLFNLKQTQY